MNKRYEVILTAADAHLVLRYGISHSSQPQDMKSKTPSNSSILISPNYQGVVFDIHGLRKGVHLLF